MKNDWLKENIKHLPLLLIIAFSFCALLVVGAMFIEGFPGSEYVSQGFFVWRILLTFLNIIIIPLGIINCIYLFEKIFKNISPWRFLLLKYVALFIGVSIATIICEGIEILFEKLIFDGAINTTNIVVQGRKLNDIEASLISNNIISVLISIPIFIRQSRNQEIVLKLKEKELQLNKTERLKTQAQLEVLQSKINPHFLYNSLNSIASLAHEDPDKVEKMAISLSKLFRYSINTSGNNYASIKEETDIVRTYLEIEKIRFGEKLQYTIKVEVDEKIQIPRFLIQPLVENSIKHGTSKITGEGFIELIIRGSNKELEIIVHDNGPAFPDNFISGYGLQSTQEKLELLFPNQYSLSYSNDNYKKVQIVIKNNNAQ